MFSTTVMRYKFNNTRQLPPVLKRCYDWHQPSKKKHFTIVPSTTARWYYISAVEVGRLLTTMPEKHVVGKGKQNHTEEQSSSSTQHRPLRVRRTRSGSHTCRRTPQSFFRWTKQNTRRNPRCPQCIPRDGQRFRIDGAVSVWNGRWSGNDHSRREPPGPPVRTHSHQPGTPADVFEMRALRCQKGRPPTGDLYKNGTRTMFLWGRRRRVCVWFDRRRRHGWTHSGIQMVHQGRIFRTEKGCRPAHAVSGSERKAGSHPHVGVVSALHSDEGAFRFVSFRFPRQFTAIGCWIPCMCTRKDLFGSFFLPFSVLLLPCVLDYLTIVLVSLLFQYIAAQDSTLPNYRSLGRRWKPETRFGYIDMAGNVWIDPPFEKRKHRRSTIGEWLSNGNPLESRKHTIWLRELKALEIREDTARGINAKGNPGEVQYHWWCVKWMRFWFRDGKAGDI